MHHVKFVGTLLLPCMLLLSVGVANVRAADSPRNLSVAIENFAFNPSMIAIPVGTTVTWTNQDPAAHTVTSDNGAFDSANLDQGQRFHFTFNTAGVYDYFCRIHPFMKARVIVTNEPNQTPISLDLHVGWNMISSPIGSVSLSALQGNCSFSGHPWRWDGTKYQQAAMIDPGKGYWVKVNSPCTMQASGSRTSQNLNLVSGWNMISSSGSVRTHNTLWP